MSRVVAVITGHTLASVNRILETYPARALAQSAIVERDAHRRNAP